MILSQKNFYLYAPLCWALADINRGPDLARMLDELVLNPGEESAKAARRALKQTFEDFQKYGEEV